MMRFVMHATEQGCMKRNEGAVIVPFRYRGVSTIDSG
jgi:hypothetical protein